MMPSDGRSALQEWSRQAKTWRKAAEGRAEGQQVMRYLVSAIGLSAAVLAPWQAHAEPHCLARALTDVPAMEAPEQVRSKSNGNFGPVTQIKINKNSGRMYFCGANTYCYDSNAFEFITPCRIKLDKGVTFGVHFTYFTR
jgi:hypothetical protein